MSPQKLESIKEEGACFIRECLQIHLNSARNESVPFQDQLTQTAEHLLPFVRLVTKQHLDDHHLSCPSDPLTFRNPTGYNHHGLTAATVMGSCLQALGFEAQIMFRCDLEPTVTLATAHSIVQVVSPEGTNYIVDPSYIQFYKDVGDEGSLPTNPVLVLPEREVPGYIENTLMTIWRKNVDLYMKGDRQTVQRMKEQDQMCPFLLHQIPKPKEMVISDPETWVRGGLHRVWDRSTYSPTPSNVGFQEIFCNVKSSSSTSTMIQPLGLAALTHYLPLPEVEKRLNDLLQRRELHRTNSREALSLIAQLPTVRRAPFASLFDVDQRIDGEIELSTSLNAYFRHFRRIVNPEGTPKCVVYGCSGADCLTVLLATNATELILVDLSKTSHECFAQARLKMIQTGEAVPNYLEIQSKFLSIKSRFSGSISHCPANGTQYMQDVELKLFYNLQSMGVNLRRVSLKERGGHTCIEFPWRYDGESTEKTRTITFITADITKPAEYPLLLREKLSTGIDIFYMKAAFYVPMQYKDFLPIIAQSIKNNGWLMTADKTMTMEAVNPEPCLEAAAQHFTRHQSPETDLFEGILQVPFDPLCSISQLDMRRGEQRIARTPGTDLSYWALLTLRQKAT